MNKPKDTNHNADGKTNFYFIWRWVKRGLSRIFSSLRLTDVGLFTAVLAVVAVLQWITLENTDKTLKAQQRAWIEPERIEIVSGQDRGERLAYVLHYLNRGKEPGTNVVIQFQQKADELPQSGPPGWFDGENEVCKITHPNPGGLVTWPNKPNQLSYSSAYPPPEAESVWEGKKTLRIEVCIGYETVGEIHYSAACFYTYPLVGKLFNQWPMVPCMNHHFAR